MGGNHLLLSPHAASRTVFIWALSFLKIYCCKLPTPAWVPRSFLPVSLFSLLTHITYLFLRSGFLSYLRLQDLCFVRAGVLLFAHGCVCRSSSDCRASGLGISHLPGKLLHASLTFLLQGHPLQEAFTSLPHALSSPPAQHLGHHGLPERCPRGRGALKVTSGS